MTTTRSLLLSFTVLTSLGLAAPHAAADAAGEALMKDFIARIHDSAMWNATAVSIGSEGADTVVKGLAITEANGPAKLELESLKITGLAQGSDGGVSMTLAAATGLKASTREASMQMPAVELQNFKTAGFADFAFDTAKPFTSVARLYTRLAKTEFSLLGIPSGLVQTNTMVPGGGPTVATTTLNGMRYENLKGGVLASMTTGKVESASAGAAGSNELMVMTWDGFSASNVNFGALAHVLDPDAYVGGKGDLVWTDFFTTARYGKLTASGGKEDVVTMAGIDIAGWQVRQTEKPFAEGLDRFARNDPKPSKEENLAILQEFGGSLFGWMRIGSLKMSDIKVKPPEGGEGALASFSIEDLSPDGLKRAAMEGLSFSAQGGGAPAMTGGLKLVEMADVTFPSLEALFTIAKFGEARDKKIPVTPEDMRKVVPAFFDMYPKFGRISIEGFSFAMPGMEPVALEYYRYASTGPFLGPIAAKTETQLKGLKLPGALLRMDPQSAQIMDGLGYAGLEFDLSDVASYDAGPGALADAISLTGKDMGTLRFGFNLNGLTRQRIEALAAPIFAVPEGQPPDMAKLIAASQGLTFDGLTLRFEDASLTRRAIALAAKMQGMDERTFTGNATAMAQLGLAQLQHPAFTQQVVTALTSYLADPKSISITIKPAKPVGVTEAMSLAATPPNQIIDLFGVTVTAND